jgi:hypothetical protein
VGKTTPNQTLRRFHALGKRVLAASARRKRRGEGVWGTFVSLGATTAAEKNRLQEARHFAQLYTDQQLDWLCALGGDVGKPLTKTQVTLLLRVADRKQRNSLARQCAKYGWSAKRLEDEIKRVGPRRNYGGRGPAPPSTVAQALVITDRLTASWNRWVSTLKPPKKRSTQPGVSLRDLPQPVRAKLMAAFNKMEQLGTILRCELDGRAAKDAPRRKNPKRLTKR